MIIERIPSGDPFSFSTPHGGGLRNNGNQAISNCIIIAYSTRLLLFPEFFNLITFMVKMKAES